MTSSRTLTRAATATVMLAAALTWGTASVAAPAAAPTATLGTVTCADGQGALEVAVTASDSEAEFGAYLSNPYTEDIDEELTLPAGQSGTISFRDLPDEDYELTVDYYDEDFEDTLLEQRISVACDAAPEGPYANAKGVIDGYCSTEVEVYAANKPIGGNTADLQPVEFTVTYAPSETAPGEGEEAGEEPGEEEPEEPGEEEPGEEEPEEPGEEEPGEELPRLAAPAPVTLETFTLDASTPTFHKTYPAEDDTFGTYTLTAGGTVIGSTETGYCVATPASGGGVPVEAGVPSTGA